MDSIFDTYKTNLPINKEIVFNIDKYYSPFRNDNGYDYDLRGRWLDYNSLYPSFSSEYSHLEDKWKLPNHPTYNIDWSKEPYATLTRMGIL